MVMSMSMEQGMKSTWIKGLSCAAWVLSMPWAMAQSSSLQEAKDALDQAPWEDKAMFIERWDAGKWRPMAQIPLRSGWVSHPSSASLRFVVWHQGPARRVEIVCGSGATESYVAWEGLRISGGSAMEFGCLSGKYRAQMGRMGLGSGELAGVDAGSKSVGEASPKPEIKE